jgi:large subunit ribosomal protein L21e
MPKSHGIRGNPDIFLLRVNCQGTFTFAYYYSVGDKVVVIIDPREHKTTPHRRFQGRVGYIKDIGRRTVKVGNSGWR